MSPAGAAKTSLNSWKEVAAHFGRAERTVKRWERERGLPIRRLPGAAGGGIFAEVAELEAWRLRAGADVDEVEATQSAGSLPRRTPPRGRWITLALIVALAALTLTLRRPIFEGAGARADITSRAIPPPLAAQKLYVAGMEDWARRTPASLNRAVAEFNGAIAKDPDYAEAWAGLAGCYNLLREFTLMPSSQAFPLARSAAEHALALDDRLAAAHASLAFADYYGFWDAAAADREFRRAIALDPRNATAHHWYATFLMEQGRAARALAEVDVARSLDPGSEAVAADRGMILYAAGKPDVATHELEALEASDPQFLSPHNYLADIHLQSGANGAYLEEAESAARLTQDRARLAAVAAARQGFAAQGRRGLLEALAAAQTEQFQNGLASAYSVARIYGQLGDKARTSAFLQLAFDRRETELTDLPADLSFAAVRSAPEFQRLERRFLGPA